MDLAHACLGSGFPVLELAAGELPTILELAIAALGCKDLSVSDDDGSGDMDCFHAILLG